METIYYRASTLWAKVLPEYKLAISLNNLKRKTKKWKKENCQCWLCRSSRLELFCKTGVLKNFTKFTGKHLCQRRFLNKVAGLRSTSLLKKRLCHRYFPVNFVNFLRAPFSIEHLWWLLLIMQNVNSVSSFHLFSSDI